MKLVWGSVAAAVLAFVAIGVGRLLFELGVVVMMIAVITLVVSLLQAFNHHDGHNS